jgi:hypothetical protein
MLQDRLELPRDAQLADHANASRSTTALDARHDAVFDIGLDAMAIASRSCCLSAPQFGAHPGCRCVRFWSVSLLWPTWVKRDSDESWRSYRAHGVGQAKLAFIELEEGEDRLGYVKTEALERLANEDMWQEFVPINLGHWEKTNLRTMSQQGNVKVEYDQYYGWTSTFSHGHWGPCAILPCKLARILCTACTGYGGQLRERWKMWRPMLVGL